MITGGSGDDVLLGNTTDNTLSGLAGNDTLDGKGGNDVLTGGIGLDIFRFSTSPGPANMDRITDFSVTDDTLQFDRNVFIPFFSLGPLAAGNLRAAPGATTAADADDYLIYDTTTGNLYYDGDGSGVENSPVQVAVLTGIPALTSADFSIV